MTDLRLEAARAAQDRKRRLADKKEAEARERRQNAPAEKRRREERANKREESIQLWRAEWDAERRDDEAVPLYEVIVEHIDITDPKFATLRARLIITTRRALVKLEAAERTRLAVPLPWRPFTEGQRSLTRAREIVALLEAHSNVTGAESNAGAGIKREAPPAEYQDEAEDWVHDRDEEESKA